MFERVQVPRYTQAFLDSCRPWELLDQSDKVNTNSKITREYVFVPFQTKIRCKGQAVAIITSIEFMREKSKEFSQNS